MLPVYVKLTNLPVYLPHDRLHMLGVYLVFVLSVDLVFLSSVDLVFV